MRRIIHKVKGWIRGGTPTHTKAASFVYVVPTPRNGPPEFPVAEQLTVLRRLSSFASKEEATVTAIFPGRPTKKMPDGSSSNGVTLRYALSDQLPKVVAEAVHAAGGNHATVLVTDDASLEKRARSSHGRTLRTATFEKALEAVSGPLRKEQPEPRQHHPEHTRPAQQHAATAPQPQPVAPQPQAATPQPPAETAPESKPKSQPAPQPARKSKDNDRERDSAILDMIDPL